VRLCDPAPGGEGAGFTLQALGQRSDARHWRKIP
jgi:hypothetical protein